MISEAVTAPATQVRLIFYVCLLISIWDPAAVFATDIPALIQKAKPAVVEILTYDQQNKLLKTGTGFFISPDGVLLTNNHVISGGSSIMAKTPTGAVYFLKTVVTASEAYDVAKLQFFATDVPYLMLGSSLSAVEGQRVLVIGNPEGLEGTVSDGIISAFRAGRTMIQITAPVSPGSSGSPVLDESGNVIGIATQVSKEGQNLNFAISTEAVRDGIAKSSVVTPSPTPLVAVTPTPSIGRLSAWDYFNRALLEGNNGNYQGAITDYTEVIRLEPTWADAYYNRSIANSKVRHFDQAISDITEAIRLKPDDAGAYYNRGNDWYDLQQYDRAIGDFTEAIRLQPDYAEAIINRGIAYNSLKQYDKAISDFDEAIRLKPGSSSAYVNRGVVFYNLQQYEIAIRNYTEAIGLKPDLAAAYGDRAFIYDKLGRSSKAAQDRKKAKELREKP